MPVKLRYIFKLIEMSKKGGMKNTHPTESAHFIVLPVIIEPNVSNTRRHKRSPLAEDDDY